MFYYMNNEMQHQLENMKDEYNFELVIDYLDKKTPEEQDEQFEEQFPKVFYLEDYDSKIPNIVEKIYGFVKTNKDIACFIKYTSSQHTMMKPSDCDDDNLMGFMMLFSFDYFQILHECLNSIYKYNEVTHLCSDKIKKFVK